MLFVATLETLPGKYEDAVRMFKRPSVPQNVKIHHFLGLFGKPDCIVVFEAPDEKAAADFTMQFAGVAEVTTSLALDISDFKWTH